MRSQDSEDQGVQAILLLDREVHLEKTVFVYFIVVLNKEAIHLNEKSLDTSDK